MKVQAGSDIKMNHFYERLAPAALYMRQEKASWAR